MNKQATILLPALLAALIGLFPSWVLAGKVELESGSLAFLRQESRVNLEYDYSDVKAGKNAKEAVPEAEFVAHQVARENGKKAGRGESWRQEWLGQRAVRLQPKFQQVLNRQFTEVHIPLEFGLARDAKYTLILKTRTMLTGSQSITADAVFVETKNRANTLAVVKLKDMPGTDFWTGTDMGEAYAKAGKDLGLLIRDKLKQAP